MQSQQERAREGGRAHPAVPGAQVADDDPARLEPDDVREPANRHDGTYAVRPKDSPGRVLGGRGWLADLIHSGSSRGPGGPSRLFCVPGIWRIAPFSQVKLCSRFH